MFVVSKEEVWSFIFNNKLVWRAFVKFNDNTVEPLIKDPPRKEHYMFNLSIGDTVWGPKNATILYSFYSLRTFEKRTTSL